MRPISAALLVVVIPIVACTGRERPANRAAGTQGTAGGAGPTGGDSASGQPPSPQPDPVISDTHAIYVARGTGNTPWTLEVFGEGIRYRWPDNPAGVVFPAGRVDGNDSSSTWLTKRSGPGPKNIQMQILRLSCVDPKTFLVSAYRVALVVDGVQRQGCAMAGPRPAAPATPRPGRP